MAKFYLEPKDAKGRTVRPEQLVRIVGVPDVSAVIDPKDRKDTAELFRYMRGKCVRTFGFSEYGLVYVKFEIRRGRFKGPRIIDIEPSCLLVQKPRKGRNHSSRKAPNKSLERTRAR